MENKNKESSIRWQKQTSEQFGYALNLVLGLSVAGIGYETTLLLNKEIERSSFQNCLLFLSLLALVISVGTALWCIISRLRDFRKTAEIARKREDNVSNVELESLRKKSKNLGEFSWLLFWWQISSFMVGILFLLLFVACTFSTGI